MKILFISGREPSYTRNEVILKGLRENGIEVIECTSSHKNYVIRMIRVCTMHLSLRMKLFVLIERNILQVLLLEDSYTFLIKKAASLRMLYF